MRYRDIRLSRLQHLAYRILTDPHTGRYAGMTKEELLREYTLQELEDYGRDVAERSGRRDHIHTKTVKKKFRRRASRHKVEEQILDSSRSISKFGRRQINRPRTSEY